ncbi:MAG: hypothetical protein JWO36_2111 [Myxococcales bacterium]|nr:hypothetical protein [Myxococcales bacterium]
MPRDLDVRIAAVVEHWATERKIEIEDVTVLCAEAIVAHIDRVTT